MMNSIFDIAKEKFDIIVQAGQSNAEGYGIGDARKSVSSSDNTFWLVNDLKTTTVYDDVFSENVKFEYDNEYSIVNAAKFIETNHSATDFSRSFSELYEKKHLKSDRKVLIIRAAVGGTGFFKKHWGLGNPLNERMLRMIDYSLSLNSENKVVAFLWHQGEHEAVFKNPPETYREQLSQTLCFLREYLGNIPFITADFCHDWADRHVMPVRTIIKEVFNKFGGAFVDTEGLTSNDQVTTNADVIHFSREAQYELGIRLFSAFDALLIKNEKNE